MFSKVVTWTVQRSLCVPSTKLVLESGVLSGPSWTHPGRESCTLNRPSPQFNDPSANASQHILALSTVMLILGAFVTAAC